MSQTILHLRGSISGGTEDAIANIDIPDDGVIEGILLSADPKFDADDEFSNVELSFIATNQIDTNDSRGSLIIMRSRAGLVTSGAFVNPMNIYVPMDIDVAGGERLYLHAKSTAGVAGSCSALVYFNPRRGLPRRSRRRR